MGAFDFVSFFVFINPDWVAGSSRDHLISCCLPYWHKKTSTRVTVEERKKGDEV
jgi:hypothetical protein